MTGAMRTPRWDPPRRAALKSLAELWRRSARLIGAREEFSWRGCSLWPAFEPVLERFMRRHFEGLAWFADRLLEFWDEEKPALALLATEAAPSQNLVAQLARLRGKPCVVSLHGWGFQPKLEHQTLSHLLAWGPEVVSLYRRAKPDVKAEIAAVGNPRFDALALAPVAPRVIGPGDTLSVFVVSQPPDRLPVLACDTDREVYAAAVAGELGKLTGWRAVFKLHPCEYGELDLYHRLLAGLGPRLKLVTRRPISRCLAEADLVVGCYSTVLLEAVVVGKPVLCVNLSRQRYAAPFDGEWGIQPVTSAADLGRCLAEARADFAGFSARTTSCYERIRGRFFGPMDGRATQRALAALAAVAGS